MYFQLSVVTAALLSTIVHAQGNVYDSIYNDLSSVNTQLKEDAFDDYGFYYDSPSLPFLPFNPSRVGRSYPDPFSWYLYHNGVPPSPHPRPIPPFFNFNVGPYGDESGNIWNQRSPPRLFDPVRGFPFLDSKPSYYNSVYGNGAFGKNPSSGKSYDSGNFLISNGRDSAYNNINSPPPFYGGFPPFLNNGPRNSDGYIIVDGKIESSKGNGSPVSPKRTKLNPGKKESLGDKINKAAPNIPSTKTPSKNESTTKNIGNEPINSEESVDKVNPTKEKEPVDEEEPTEEEEPTKEKSTMEHPTEGDVAIGEKPIKEKPIEEPIEKVTIKVENDETATLMEPED